MTDAATPAPRTAAGREEAECPECGTRCYVERHKLHVHYSPIEAQARPAVASEGLRAALEADLSHLRSIEQKGTLTASGRSKITMIERYLALASDAGSVAALDVERLRIIATISENRVTVEQADALGWLDGWLTDAERQGEGE